MTMLVDMENKTIAWYIDDEFQCRRAIPKMVWDSGDVYAIVELCYPNSEIELVKWCEWSVIINKY